MSFDFKKYHIRAMNAVNEAEKVAINLELKAYYESLPDEEKETFNTELESFLIGEMRKIKSVYEGVNPSDN